MRTKRICALLLCLLLLFPLAAGCSQIPQEELNPAAASEQPAAGTAQPETPAAETPAQEAETPAAQEQPAAGEEPSPLPEASPAPASEGISLPGGATLPVVVTLSAGSFPSDAKELKTVITAADIPQLERFPDLKSADFSGSSCQKELSAWTLEHPEVSVRCEVRLSDGTVIPADTRELELSDETPGEELLALVLLPELKTVELGECLDAAESPLDWEALAQVQAARPDVEFHYSFHLYKKSFDLQSTEMDLNHITMTDDGALVKKVAACMPELTLLDMDFCDVDNEHMAQIRDSLPNTEVVWRIWFGDNPISGYSVRTNVTKILASNPGIGGELTPENTVALQYCTKVKYLDLGHNDQLTDLSFVRCMPDLEVAVLAMGGFRDLSPLADCPKLEYLEIQTGAVSDLRPLSTMKSLRHLNIAWNYAITDITPLYELTDLERLWIGAFDPVPRDQIEEMQRRAPNCQINFTTRDPTAEGWRYTEYNELGYGVPHPRYELLREQFDYGSAPWCYSYIRNDPLYQKHD
jgi:hypothetical protein